MVIEYTSEGQQAPPVPIVKGLRGTASTDGTRNLRWNDSGNRGSSGSDDGTSATATISTQGDSSSSIEANDVSGWEGNFPGSFSSTAAPPPGTSSTMLEAGTSSGSGNGNLDGTLSITTTSPPGATTTTTEARDDSGGGGNPAGTISLATVSTPGASSTKTDNDEVEDHGQDPNEAGGVSGLEGNDAGTIFASTNEPAVATHTSPATTGPEVAIISTNTQLSHPSSEGNGEGGDGTGGHGEDGNVAYCFSGKNIVEVLDKGSVTMDSIKIGDYIRIGPGHDFAQVNSLGDYTENVLPEYVHIRTDVSASPLEPTKDPSQSTFRHRRHKSPLAGDGGEVRE
jgi:hypothetical protein